MLVPLDWSPVHHYAPARQRRAEIRRERVSSRSTYWAEGVRGALTYRYAAPATMTVLTIGGKVWMTDEPPYTYSLASFAERARGDVLVAGLGLGIVLHQLSANPAVERITVVEHERDVLDLVSPRLPRDSRIKLVEQDFDLFVCRDRERRDAVIWDLGVWSDGGSLKDRLLLLAAAPVLREKYGPSTQVFTHGLDRDPVGEAFVQTDEFKRARSRLWR